MLTRIRKVLILLCMILLVSVGVVSSAFAVDELVGAWLLEEHEGNVAPDSSAYGNNGTTYDCLWVYNDRFGEALCFNGVDAYMDVNVGTSLPYTNKITIESWVKVYDLNKVFAVASKRSGASSNDFQLYYEPTQKQFYCIFWGTTVGGFGTGANSVSANTWYHVVATYNGSIAKIYINGIEKSAKVGTGNVNNNNFHLRIGSDFFGHYGHGLVDELKIYNYARSEEDIFSEYEKFGPIGIWRLNENGGSVVNDSSYRGHNGIVYGNASWLEYGLSGSALSFDGVNDYVEISLNHFLPYFPQITIESWVKVHDLNKVFAIASKRGVGIGDDFQLYFDNTQKQVYCIFWGTTVGGFGTGANSISANTWYHVVATYNGSVAKIYINGIERASKAGTGLVNNRYYNNLRIGEDFCGHYGAGVVDELKIYDCALNENEIKKRYKKLSTSLVSHWSFNENYAGYIANDYGSNSNNATRYGAVWTSDAKFGSALSFDGVDDYALVQNSASLNITNAITIEAWVKLNKLTHQYIVAKTNSNCSENGYGIALDPNGKFEMVLWGGASIALRNAPGGTLAQTGVWYHVVGVCDGYTVYVYVNGTLDRLANGGMPSSIGSSPLKIGKIMANSYPTKGIVDEVKIYNRALTADEVLEAYNLQPVYAVGSSIQEWNSSLYGYNYVADGKIATRWSSLWNSENEWIYIYFGTPRTFNTVKLNWEAAYGEKYKIQISNYGNPYWETIYEETNGNGGIDEILVGPKTARYVRMQGIKRGAGYGYSLWEFGVYK